MPVINYNPKREGDKIQQIINSKNDVLTVGKKYKGYTVEQVNEMRPEYLAWLLLERMIIVEDDEVRDMIDEITMECVEDGRWPYYTLPTTGYVNYGYIDYDEMEAESWSFVQNDYCGDGH